MGKSDLNLATFLRKALQYLKASVRLSLYRGGGGLFRLVAIALVALLLLSIVPWMVLFFLLTLERGIACLLVTSCGASASFWSALIVLGLVGIAFFMVYGFRKSIMKRVMSWLYLRSKPYWDRIDEALKTPQEPSPSEHQEDPLL